MSDARGCRSRWTDPVKEGGIDVHQYKAAVTRLEQVFLSREFEDARDERVLHSVTQAAGELPPARRLEDAVVAMLPTVPRESTRHRAIAAASGVAAAALVVAGLASRSAQQRRGDISAQGSGASVESTRAPMLFRWAVPALRVRSRRALPAPVRHRPRLRVRAGQSRRS